MKSFTGWMVLLNFFLTPAAGANTIWQVAQGFERQGNYFEAITEYRRLLYQQPGAPAELRTKIELHIGDLYFASGNLTMAERWYENPELYEARLRRLDLAYATGKPFYPLLLETLRSGIPEQEELARLRIEAARAFLSRGERRAAAELLKIPLPAGSRYEEQRLLLEVGMASSPATYSRWNLLWGIFPGGVYWATGNYQLGALSSLTVGGLTALSVFALFQGYWVSGFLAAVFAFRYYLDSLYQGWNWLRTENERLLREQELRLLQTTGGPVVFAAGDSAHLQLLRTVRF